MNNLPKGNHKYKLFGDKVVEHSTTELSFHRVTNITMEKKNENGLKIIRFNAKQSDGHIISISMFVSDTLEDLK